MTIGQNVLDTEVERTSHVDLQSLGSSGCMGETKAPPAEERKTRRCQLASLGTVVGFTHLDADDVKVPSSRIDAVIGFVVIVVRALSDDGVFRQVAGTLTGRHTHRQDGQEAFD